MKSAELLGVALQEVATDPPYILVGHSWGAFCVRAFAALFPRKVCGMVLVDPTTEECLSAAEMSFPDELSKQIGIIGRYSSAGAAEIANLHRSCEQMAAASFPPNTPVILISAMKPPRGTNLRLFELSLRCHSRLVRRYDMAQHIMANHSGHNVMVDEPELIVTAVEDIATHARELRRTLKMNAENA